jgi:hypothetical protein
VKREVPARQILSVNRRQDQDSSLLDVSFLSRNKKKTPFSLVKIEGKINGYAEKTVAVWVDSAIHLAYQGTSFPFTHSAV